MKAKATERQLSDVELARKSPIWLALGLLSAGFGTGFVAALQVSSLGERVGRLESQVDEVGKFGVLQARLEQLSDIERKLEAVDARHASNYATIEKTMSGEVPVAFLKCRRIDIVDTQGATRIVLGVDDKGVAAMAMRDRAGHAMAVVQVVDNASQNVAQMLLFDGKEVHERVNISASAVNGSMLAIMRSAGLGGFHVKMPSIGSPSMFLGDALDPDSHSLWFGETPRFPGRSILAIQDRRGDSAVVVGTGVAESGVALLPDARLMLTNGAPSTIDRSSAIDRSGANAPPSSNK